MQATDQWIGVRGARTILIDNDMVRAPLVANWLAQLGHNVFVMEGGMDAARDLAVPPPRVRDIASPSLPDITAQDIAKSAADIIDLRPGMTYRKGHVSDARWSIRPRLPGAACEPAKPIVLIGSDDVVELAAGDLARAGHSNIKRLKDDIEGWRAAGLEVVETPDQPADADCIDFLFFTAERHNANEAASRQYLEWEIGLVDQLDDQERGSFRIVTPP